jgi:hypothetical protein
MESFSKNDQTHSKRFDGLVRRQISNVNKFEPSDDVRVPIYSSLSLWRLS